MTKLTKTCRQCGEGFAIPPCRDWREHYCSSDCRSKFNLLRKEELKRKCPICETEFYSRRNVEIKTCSRKCSGIAARGTKQTEEWIRNRLESFDRNGNRERLRKVRGPIHPQFIGTKISLGYVWVWHNGRYVAEHRMVAERMIGRKLLDTEVVHHRNENRTDNREENLVVMSRAEHMKEHALEITAARKMVKNSRGNKLGIEEVSAIKAQIRKGDSRRDIALRHGITTTMVSYIANGKSWANV